VVLSGEGAELYELIDTDLRRGIAEVIHPSLAPVDLEVRELSLTDWARGAAVIAIQDHLTLRTHRPDQTGLTRPPDRISPGM